MNNMYYGNNSKYKPNYMYRASNNNTFPYNAGQTMYGQELSRRDTDSDYPFSNGYQRSFQSDSRMELKDYGPEPFAVNINKAAKQNDTFRTALWTGEHLQVTLMSLNVGEDIGFEIHPNLDQFIRIEEGQGLVLMGDQPDNINFKAKVNDDFAFIVPAGTWHNLMNTGLKPLKLYSIYAPPQHPHGTIHETKKDAMAGEKHHED